ncbi:hypothetical protein [Primorskyibacter sp. S187A]
MLSKFSVIYMFLSGIIVVSALAVHADARGADEGAGLLSQTIEVLAPS